MCTMLPSNREGEMVQVYESIVYIKHKKENLKTRIAQSERGKSVEARDGSILWVIRGHLSPLVRPQGPSRPPGPGLLASASSQLWPHADSSADSCLARVGRSWV